MISCLTVLASQVILWKYKPKEIKILKPEVKEMIGHFKKSIILFIPILMLNIYIMSDKIIVGNICGMEEVGYYNYAQKIIDLLTSLIIIVGEEFDKKAFIVSDECFDIKGEFKKYLT